MLDPGQGKDVGDFRSMCTTPLLGCCVWTPPQTQSPGQYLLLPHLPWQAQTASPGTCLPLTRRSGEPVCPLDQLEINKL